MKFIKKLSNKKFWKAVVPRFISLPGYVLLFAAWAFLLGLLATGLYVWAFGSVETSEVNETGTTFRVIETGLLELLLMMVITLVSWSGIAYFTGKVLRRLNKHLKITTNYVPAVKMGLLCLGWLILVTVVALVFSEFDYVVLIAGGVFIAIGSFSFALEILLLKVLGLSVDDSW